MNPATNPDFNRNKWTFGLGTFGRDMVYTLISMYLIFYLTEVVKLTNTRLWWISTLMLAIRVVDAFIDIIMGKIVDNTHTRFGTYKPWITGGAVSSAIFTLLLFAESDNGWWYVIVFTLIYLAWSLSWTTNDIPYWSLLPALSLDQREREQAGAIAKTTASIGTFIVVIGILPLTDILGTAIGNKRAGWLIFTAGIVVIMLIFQLVTIIGVREPHFILDQKRTTIHGLFETILRNDQLLWVSLAMVIFQTGFIATTSFGTYYFKYAYGDQSMYSIFALVLAIGQLSGYIIFPALSRRYSRSSLYRFATIIITVGYLLFFFSPNNIFILSIAGLPTFFGDALIVMLMLMFLSDTIDYGHWKIGRRNTAITFSLQPFINKVSGALGTQIVAITVIFSGINVAHSPAEVTKMGIFELKIMMFLLPLVLIVAGYLILKAKYKLDAKTYAQITAELRRRNELI